MPHDTIDLFDIESLWEPDPTEAAARLRLREVKRLLTELTDAELIAAIEQMECGEIRRYPADVTEEGGIIEF